MDHLPEKDILELLKSDSEEAFDQLFKLFYTFLCQTIYMVIRDKSVSEDLAQDVLFELWKKKDQININTSLKAYLRRSASNRALNHIRDQKMQFSDHELLPELESKQINSLHQMQIEELKEIIQRSIDKLPERCRAVFTLSRYEEKSYKEIAELLGISIKTVENQISKALRVLRNDIGPYI